MISSYVHDPRHRYGYELRPDEDLDARLRALAATLEAEDLLADGASTAPRFHPHLTFGRAATLLPVAVDAIAAAMSGAAAQVELVATGSFGSGRIAWLGPAERGALDDARAAWLDAIDTEALDPLATNRPWTPHVTIAYSVPDHAQAEVLERLRAALPLVGTWRCAQAWDLDVRPTRLEHERRVLFEPAPPG